VYKCLDFVNEKVVNIPIFEDEMGILTTVKNDSTPVVPRVTAISGGTRPLHNRIDTDLSLFGGYIDKFYKRNNKK